MSRAAESFLIYDMIRYMYIYICMIICVSYVYHFYMSVLIYSITQFNFTHFTGNHPILSKLLGFKKTPSLRIRAGF